MESSTTSKSFTSAEDHDLLKKRYALTLVQLKWLVWIVGIVLIVHVVFSTIYKDSFTSPTIRNIHRYFSSPDGRHIILLSEDNNGDVTFLLSSHDGGLTWTEDSTAYIIDMSVNWKNGETIGIGDVEIVSAVIDTTAVDTVATSDTTAASYGPYAADESQSQRQEFGQSYTQVWKSKDYGVNQTPIQSLDILADSININWKTGVGYAIDGFSRRREYTRDFGETWSLTRPDIKGFNSEFTFNIKDISYEGDSITVFYRHYNGSLIHVGFWFDQSLVVFITEDDWKTTRAIYPLVKATQTYGIVLLLRVLTYASWIGIIAMIGLVGYRRFLLKRITANEALTENMLAMMSDNPSTEDRLGFASTSEAILRLLRNPDSKPPVSIAVNGRWGSGKSSLMAQLQKELANDKRFVTLWFNVWHFQSEDHMLASFLSSILQVFENSFGFLFRCRLFLNKLFRLPFSNRVLLYTGILIITPFVLYLILSLYPFSLLQHSLRALDLPGTILRSMDSIFQMMTSLFTSKDKNATDYAIPIFSILTWLAGILFLRKEWLPSGLSSFFELIPLEKFKMEAAKEDPGFREKYKREFWEILEAAGDDKRYVVFVDDMDRINGSRLKDLMEGINFISDTASRPSQLSNAKASIFFVLGMSVDEVVYNLGKELNPNATPVDQKIYGAAFMQKMVDLVVQVPPIDVCTQEQLNTILLRDDERKNIKNIA